MSVIGLMFGYAIARGRPDASRIALVSALPTSPVLGLVLGSALVRNETPAGTGTSLPQASELLVAAQSQSPSEILVTWDSVSDAKSYIVRRYRHRKTREQEKVFKDQSSPFSDKHLDISTWYSYVVEAFDNHNNVIAVGTASAQTQGRATKTLGVGA